MAEMWEVCIVPIPPRWPRPPTPTSGRPLLQGILQNELTYYSTVNNIIRKVRTIDSRWDKTKSCDNQWRVQEFVMRGGGESESLFLCFSLFHGGAEWGRGEWGREGAGGREKEGGGGGG